MSNREMVIGLLEKLPENTPLEDIAHEIEFLAGIQIAREQARNSEGVSPKETRDLLSSWASQ